MNTAGGTSRKGALGTSSSSPSSHLTSSSCCWRPPPPGLPEPSQRALWHWTGGMSLTCRIPRTTSPGPWGPGFWPHAILSQTPAQPTSPQSRRTLSSSSCHFTLRVVGDRTWSESGPDSSSLPTSKNSVHWFSHRVNTESLKPKP